MLIELQIWCRTLGILLALDERECQQYNHSQAKVKRRRLIPEEV
jgi:hypothetical protein